MNLLLLAPDIQEEIVELEQVIAECRRAQHVKAAAVDVESRSA